MRQILRSPSVIIRFLASKSLSLMLFGVPGLKRILISILALIAGSVTIISCGSSSNSSSSSSSTTTTHKPSGIKFRVFISNPLYPQGTTGAVVNTQVLNIVDATLDKLALTFFVPLTGISLQPSLMTLAPNGKYTAVFSPNGNTVAIVDNATEAVAVPTGSTTPLPAIPLPGLTESLVVSNFATTAYAAVPTAPIAGQSPGAVVVMSLQTGSVSATIPVPGAHFIVLSPDGNHLLVFSDNSDIVTVITTPLIGTATDPRSYTTGFDRPVWGIFAGNNTAYILNCGAQCGGTAAGVSVADVGASAATSTTPVSAATFGVVSGSTLYVAGTPPGTNTCTGSVTAAPTCGRLTAINTNSMTVTGSAIITDGYHGRMQVSQNGQLFIGSYGCTNINIVGGEVRGCLSIFNTNTGGVVIPPSNGNVTGLQQITGRNTVYVIQNAELGIYDTTTDALQVTPSNGNNNDGQIDIVGQPFDVKLVD
jgi:hypothetical protein